MANIKFKASKKTTVILLVVLFLVIGGTGAYLLWRVNQQKTVAPTDSSAGANQCNCCPNSCQGTLPPCSQMSGCNKNPPAYPVKCECVYTQSSCPVIPVCNEGSPECSKGSHCPACKWPLVAYCRSGKCTCERYDSDDGSGIPEHRCDDTKPCVKCPEGYEMTSDTGPCKEGEIEKSGSCSCLPCHNPYTATICCKQIVAAPKCGDGKVDPGEECDGTPCPDGQACTPDCKCPVANTCDDVGADANIRLEPTNPPEYCGDTRYKYVAADSDGVGTVTVKLDGVTLTPDVNIPDPNNSTRRFIEGNIPGKTYHCNSTKRTLTISWTDAKGKEGVGGKCTRSITYTPGANACDGGGWDTGGNPGAGPSNTTRVYKYCEDIKYSATGRDKHGIKTMTVKLNGAVRNVTPVKTATTARVSEVLSSKSRCLAPGTYTLNIAWTDAYGAGGSGNCALTTKFVVSEEVQPEWSIDKEPAKICIDENTENPKGELSYTIKITNTGTVAGKITDIVDTLDAKVSCAIVSDISNNGNCSNGKITWQLSSPLSDFTPSQSKTFTYKYIVGKESFGEYENTVKATVAATGTKPATTIQDATNITVDCMIKDPEQPYVPPTGDGVVPDTGLFDESENIVIIGGILLFLGLGWTWLTKTYQIVNGRLVERSKERFEQRVVKK